MSVASPVPAVPIDGSFEGEPSLPGVVSSLLASVPLGSGEPDSLPVSSGDADSEPDDSPPSGLLSDGVPPPSEAL